MLSGPASPTAGLVGLGKNWSIGELVGAVCEVTRDRSRLSSRLDERLYHGYHSLVVAQHTVAMRVAAVTDMIATVPRRMALLEAPKKVTKILEGPAALA